MVFLEVVVVVVGIRTEFHFLHFHPMLLFLRLILPLFLLIRVLPVVHHLAHGGIRRRRNEYEIKALFLGFLHADMGRQNLGLAIRKYYANLLRPNELIDIVFPGSPVRSKRSSKNNKPPLVVQLPGSTVPEGLAIRTLRIRVFPREPRFIRVVFRSSWTWYSKRNGHHSSIGRSAPSKYSLSHGEQTTSSHFCCQLDAGSTKKGIVELSARNPLPITMDLPKSLIGSVCFATVH